MRRSSAPPWVRSWPWPCSMPVQVKGALLVAVLGVAALSHVVRWWLWAPHKTLRTPLVWVLHAAYVWIPIHLALRIGAELQLIAPPLAVHALTVGAIGGLTIGMMTRTAKGHTGQILRADAGDIACYSLVLAAGVARVFGPLLLPALYAAWVLISAMLWSAGFALYAVRYWSALTRARLTESRASSAASHGFLPPHRQW